MESILQAEDSRSLAIWGKETVEIDILVTPRNGNSKIMQPITIMSEHTMKMKRWNQLSQFR